MLPPLKHYIWFAPSHSTYEKQIISLLEDRYLQKHLIDLKSPEQSSQSTFIEVPQSSSVSNETINISDNSLDNTQEHQSINDDMINNQEINNDVW